MTNNEVTGMADWMFDRDGRPQIIVDGDCFRSARGAVIGWISGGSAYSLRGAHLGWYEGGVLYDGNNRAISYCRAATGHLPSRPGLSGTPGMPGFAGRPGRPGLAGVPGRPGYGNWSDVLLESFFE